jgi:hypothetical protein
MLRFAAGKVILLSYKTSTPLSRLSQSPVRRVTVFLQQEETGQGVNLTTYLLPRTGLRKRGSIPPLAYIHDVQRDNVTFILKPEVISVVCFRCQNDITSNSDKYKYTLFNAC